MSSPGLIVAFKLNNLLEFYHATVSGIIIGRTATLNTVTTRRRSCAPEKTILLIGCWDRRSRISSSTSASSSS